MFNVSRFHGAAVVAVLAAVVSSAHASVVYDFDLTTTPGAPAGPAPYATITLDSVTVDGAQGVHFTVTSVDDGYTVYSLFLNARDLTDSSKVLALSLIPDDESLANFDFEGKGKFDSAGFGKFDYFVDPYYQFTGQTSYSFTLMANDSKDHYINISPDNFVFLSQGGKDGSQIIAANFAGCGTSGVIGGSTPEGGGPPVPEPASLSLLAVGASSLLLRRKRRS